MKEQGTHACERMQGLLCAYADGELNKKQAAAVEKHVCQCPSCARELEEMRALTALVSDAAEDVVAPARLHASVMQTLDGTPRDARRPLAAPLGRRLGTVMAAFACVMVGAVVLAMSGVLDGAVKNVAFDAAAPESSAPSNDCPSDVYGDADLPMADGAQNDGIHWPPMADDAESASGEPGAASPPSASDTPDVSWDTPMEPEADWEDSEVCKPSVGMTYRLVGPSEIDSNSLPELLDGVWEGDGLMMSFSRETSEVKVEFSGMDTRLGEFVLRDGVLTILFEDGERLDFFVKAEEGVLWLTSN